MSKTYTIYAYASPENRVLATVSIGSDNMPICYGAILADWDRTSPNVGERYPLGKWDYAERTN